MTLTELSERDFLALVNSEFADACSPSRLRRLKDSFGFRVKDKRGKLNALAIAPIQWRRLWDAIDKQDNPTDREAYLRAKQLERREALRDIGEIPAVADPELRARCDADLETFLREVFPKIFHIEWCSDHRELCRALQSSVETGGKKAVAYQRGFGKTQFCIGAICWGILTGRLPMVLLISKNETEAAEIQAGIQRRFETNPKLIALYPEVCWVMSVLRKAPGKRSYKGQPIELKTGDQMVLPFVPGSRASEAVIKCAGIMSSGIRGAHYDRSDGSTVRPRLVLLDDPQDETSARNPETIRKLCEVIDKAVSGVNGPNERLAIFMPCTVIQPGDLAWQYTDIIERPEWDGRRIAAMDRLPDELLKEHDEPGKLNLWRQFERILREDLAMRDKDHQRATAFYLKHRDTMAAGASVRWVARFEPPCVDAVQWLVIKYLLNRETFLAEFQQCPLASAASINYLNEQQLGTINNGMERGAIPPDVERVIATIDIQENVLYWMLTGWAPHFTGYVLTWGTWPEQPPGRFTHHNVTRTITQEIRRLYAGQPLTWIQERKLAIAECCRLMLGELEQNGAPRFADGVFVDARWEKIEATVVALAGSDEFRGRVFPMGGQYIGPNRAPMSRAALKPGQIRVKAKECEWYMDNRGSGVYFIEFDANTYRTRTQTGLAKAALQGAVSGRITYAGREGSKFLASHLAARIPEIREGNFRKVEHWNLRPGTDQDHWNDCLIMSRIGAEHEGLRADGTNDGKPKRMFSQLAEITQQTITNVPKARP
jgi:hypothetical protein